MSFTAPLATFRSSQNSRVFFTVDPLLLLLAIEKWILWSDTVFMLLFFSLLTSFVSCLANAGTFTHTTASASATSDFIELRQVDLDYKSKAIDLFWPYRDEEPSADFFGATLEYNQGSNTHSNYVGGHVGLTYGQKTSPKFLWLETVGIDVLHQSARSATQNTLLTDGLVQWAPTATFSSAFELKHGYIYTDLIQPGSVDDYIQALSGSLRVLDRIQDFRTQLLLTGGLYSDENRRSCVDLSVLYKIDEATNWIWAGFGAEQLNYRKRSNYWSPSSFWSVGPRFEAVVPFSTNWQVGLGLNLNHFQELGFETGNGYYGNLRLQYGTRESRNFSLSYTRITAQQDDHLWFENSLSLDINYPL